MKKYSGVFIALLPFISGTYKTLGDWSSAELVGYNTSSLLLIGFGIYYFLKHQSKPQPVDLAQYDLAVFKASAFIKELSEDTKENMTVKRVAINEIGNLVDLCHKNRSKRWKSQKEVDEVASDLIKLVEDNKKLIKEAQNINI